MDSEYKGHQRKWRVLQTLVGPIVRKKFDITAEDIHVDGPMLLIPNHVTSWDPLLVALSLRDKQVYYVASEHLFRKGLKSSLLKWMVAPIPRSKGTAGTDTVRTCLRHLKAGHSVCIFAEGEQSWDGRNNPVYEATGKLARISGATLVTYRLEGAYLSRPRWADTTRHGKVYGHPVGIYSPDQLRSMTPDEISDTINRDIREDAWERQAEHPQEYKGKKLAEGLERMLYLCPKCRRIGTLSTADDELRCTCGFSLKYGTDGAFHPGEPFNNIAQWEDWQRSALDSDDFEHGDELFSDENVSLFSLANDHTQTPVLTGKLIQYPDRIEIGDHRFNMKDIDDLAMTRTHILLLSSEGSYYQLSAEKGINFRKYLEIFRAFNESV